MREFGYPQARRLDLTEDVLGYQVSDPYRWLEDDASDERAGPAGTTAPGRCGSCSTSVTWGPPSGEANASSSPAATPGRSTVCCAASCLTGRSRCSSTRRRSTRPG